MHKCSRFWNNFGTMNKWTHRELGKWYFCKPFELEIKNDEIWRFRGKFCRNFYMRKKTWEKRIFGRFLTGIGEIGLHLSPKFSWMMNSHSSCFFTSPTTRVCQNITGFKIHAKMHFVDIKNDSFLKIFVLSCIWLILPNSKYRISSNFQISADSVPWRLW